MFFTIGSLYAQLQAKASQIKHARFPLSMRDMILPIAPFMTAGHLPDFGAGDFCFRGAVWLLPVV